MNNLIQLDNVMYKVKDLDNALPFYTNVLGLKQVWRDDEKQMIGLQMQKGEGEIVITSDPDAPDFDYSFLVENVESFCSNVTELGYEIVLQPFDVRCGKYAVVSDLDGNKIPIIDLTAFGGKPKYD